jgi:hypothetical protein
LEFGKSCWINTSGNASADDAYDVSIAQAIDSGTSIELGATKALPIETVALVAILGKERCAALDSEIVLEELCRGLVVRFHNPETGYHESDNRQHDEGAIPRFLYRVGARIKYVE